MQTSPRLFRALIAIALAVTIVASNAPAGAALLDCGQPLSAGTSPTATDALFVLRTAVGLEACSVFVCDVNATCSVSATDSLRVLQNAVGQEVELACGLGCSIGSAITDVAIDIDLLDTDSISVAGTFDEFPVKGTPGFVILVGDVAHAVPIDDLVESSGGNVLSYSNPDGIGVVDVEIDLVARTFELRLEQVFLSSLPNPFLLQFEFSATTECRVVQLIAPATASNANQRSLEIAPGPAQTMPCVFANPVADPPTLVEPEAALAAGQGAGDTTDVELSIVLTGVDPVPDSVQVRRVLGDGTLDSVPICTMSERPDSALAAVGARAYACGVSLAIHGSTTNELIAHELVHVVTASGTGSAGLSQGEEAISHSIEVVAVPRLGSPGAADLQSTLATASDTWAANLSLAPTQEEAEVDAVKAIRGLDGIRNVTLTPDEIIMETDTGVGCAIPLFDGQSCSSTGGNCAVRCGGSAVGGGLGNQLAGERRDGYMRLNRSAPAEPSALYYRAAVALADDEPTVITNHKIVLWDPDFFGGEVDYIYDAGDPDLYDPSVAGRSVEADRQTLRDLVQKSQCPKFELIEHVGAAGATVDAFRSDATAGGMFVIITHGVIPKQKYLTHRFVSREELTAQSMIQYADDLQSRGLVIQQIDARGDFALAITPAFIRKLPGSFEDTMVWAGACHSGANVYPRQSDAFLAKGASVYYGFTQSVSDQFGRLAGELAFTRVLAERGTSDEAFADVLPKLDPINAYSYRGLTFKPKPPPVLVPEKLRARLVMERAMESVFIGKAELTPQAPVLTGDETAMFTVAIEGTEECTGLIYRWSNTADVGSLDGDGGTDDFDSDEPSAVYTADPSVDGTDTVRVQVIVMEEGEERVLGEAETVVDVTSDCVGCSDSTPPPLAYPGQAVCQQPIELCCTDGLNNDDDDGQDCFDIDCRSNPNCVLEGNFTIRTLTYTNFMGAESFYHYVGAFVDIDSLLGGARYCVQVDQHDVPVPPPFTGQAFPFEPPYEYEIQVGDPCLGTLRFEEQHFCEGWLGDQLSIVTGLAYGAPIGDLQAALDLLAPLQAWTYEARLKTRDEEFCNH